MNVERRLMQLGQVRTTSQIQGWDDTPVWFAEFVAQGVTVAEGIGTSRRTALKRLDRACKDKGIR